MNAELTGSAHGLRFEGQVALVTGAASGIGAATTRRLAAEGAHVIALGRDMQSLGALVRDIVRAGGRAEAAQVDVLEGAALEAAVGRAVDRHGRLDVIVSNAGIGRRGAVDTQPTAELRELMDTHVDALWHLCRAAIGTMRSQGRGAVAAVTSVHAYATLPLLGAYAASKTAMLGLVRGLALDHAADGIRVNAVAPGSVDTPMLQRSAALRDPVAPEAIMRDWGARQPIGRLIEPDEVASAIAYLCSPEAGAITGVCLPVDGGLLARLAL